MPVILASLASLLCLGGTAAAHWQYTSFRAIGPATIAGDTVALKVVVDQGPKGMPADFFAHPQEPKHRKSAGPTDGVTAGLPLGSVMVPANKAVEHTFRVKLADLAKAGVKPGGTVHLAMVCEVGNAVGGLHEYGLDGDRDVTLRIPAAGARKNSGLRRSGRPAAWRPAVIGARRCVLRPVRSPLRRPLLRRPLLRPLRTTTSR